MSDEAHLISREAAGIRPIRDTARDILQDIGQIVQGEIRLAKTELAQKAAALGKAAGTLAAAGVAGLLAGACFVTAGMAGLALVMPLWLGALIIGSLLAFAAAGAYAVGRTRMTRIEPVPQRTVQTMKENIRTPSPLIQELPQ